MNSQSLPPELGQFVEQQVATGRYRTEEDVIVDAVRVLREVEAQQAQFREEVRRGLDQLAAGEYTDYDEQGLRERFERLKQRALSHTDGQ